MTDPDAVPHRIEAKLDQLLAAQQPCEACAERKREEDADTEQWKREFMARHGLTELAEGGLVKGPGPDAQLPIQVTRGDYIISPATARKLGLVDE